jgi:hypothetical protein
MIPKTNPAERAESEHSPASSENVVDPVLWKPPDADYYFRDTLPDGRRVVFRLARRGRPQGLTLYREDDEKGSRALPPTTFGEEVCTRIKDADPDLLAAHPTMFQQRVLELLECVLIHGTKGIRNDQIILNVWGIEPDRTTFASALKNFYHFCGRLRTLLHDKGRRGTSRLLIVAEGVTRISAKVEVRDSDVCYSDYQKLAGSSPIPSRLPLATGKFIGRERELEALDRAWADPNIGIVMFTAWGGVGKTALVRHWRDKFELAYGPEVRVFDWTFYSQGATGRPQTSAVEFMNAAFSSFGAGDNKGPFTFDQGAKLAGLITQQRAVLILDGLEPLQYGLQEQDGRLTDPGLKGLLSGLVRGRDGLCIITTRWAVGDIRLKRGVVVEELSNLDPEIGGRLLWHLGAKRLADWHLGEAAPELREIASGYKGHGLALTLLGRYLGVVHGGDIRGAKDVPLLLEVPESDGRHAQRVMQAYEFHLQSRPETLEILRLMGLFDRPAEPEEIEALTRSPAIAGLTDSAGRITRTGWKFAVRYLRDLGLLYEDTHEVGDLDCHPLLKEYYGAKLRGDTPAAWKEANHRLCTFHLSQVAQDRPDNLNDLVRLHRAGVHGCLAGEFRMVLRDIYVHRISQGYDGFATRTFGLFGVERVLLRTFFTDPWKNLASGLTDIEDQIIVFRCAGFCLWATGGPSEGLRPMAHALKLSRECGNAFHGGIAGRNLAQMNLALGRLRNAAQVLQENLSFVDAASNKFLPVAFRCSLGHIFHQMKGGQDPVLANGYFEEALELQRKWADPNVFSELPTFQYVDFLLTCKRFEEASNRISSMEKRSTFGRGLAELVFGIIGLRNHSLDTAGTHLEAASDLLRSANRPEYIAHALLARAELCRHTDEFESAWRCLTEAQEIAERGELKLYQTDFHLEASRLALMISRRDLGSPFEGLDSARVHFEKAKALVDETGYYRRGPELQELMVALAI